MRGGALELGQAILLNQQRNLPRSHLVASADLAVRLVTLPPCTCGYLVGAASVALGRTPREDPVVVHGTLWRGSDQLHQRVTRSSVPTHLVVIL